MKNPHQHTPLKAIALAVATLVSACGGGGTANTPVSISGKVIDGYISGAIVCLDLNANNTCDTGEPAATSDAEGSYAMTAPSGTDLSKLHVIATVPAGAFDSDSPTTPVTKPYILMSPAPMANVVSPLSTAVSTHMLVNGKGLADARIQARADLALPVDYDFLKDHVATKDTAAHNVAKVMAAYLASSQGTATPTTASLSSVLTSMKSAAAAAYASTDVSATVSQ